jgi:extradiol dioxygenase family protein
MTAPAIFHHAFQVDDLAAARQFYGELLGCPVARRAQHPTSVDFNFFGHHIVCHLAQGADATRLAKETRAANLRYRHFGVVLPWDDWETLLHRLARAGVEPLFPPRHSYVGEAGEEAFFMLRDPAGHVLEFKTFRDLGCLFAAP